MLDFLLRIALQLIEPLGVLWLGLIVLTLLLRRRRQMIPYFISAFLTLLITIIGGTDVASWLLLRLERPWAGVKLIELPACDAVVVLGGGVEASRNDVDGVRLTKAGDRVLTGMELMRWGRAPAMIIGGGSARVDDVEKVESDLICARIGDWKPPRVWEIVSLGAAADTHDESLRLVPLAKQRGWKKNPPRHHRSSHAPRRIRLSRRRLRGRARAVQFHRRGKCFAALVPHRHPDLVRLRALQRLAARNRRLADLPPQGLARREVTLRF